jgi:zinc transport system substrate-binding protein
MRRLPALALAAGLATGCQDVPTAAVAPAPRPVVVASFYTLAEFARQVAGDRAEVVALVPTGVEPHDWEPSPRDLVTIEKAAVLVYNGAGFDAGVERIARNVPPKTVVVEATAGLPLVLADHPADGHDDAHGHRHSTDKRARGDRSAAQQDPHVWLDPRLAKAQVDAIRGGLAKADPTNAEHYATRAAGYMARLGALDEAFGRGLAQCRRREIVVSHAAFTYLAHRYKLLQVPVMGLAPQAEPSPARLAQIVRQVRRLKAEVIFSETLVNQRLAETLAREVGARTLVLNPVEGLTDEEARAGKDYVSVMEENLRSLRDGLGCG